tara:strand:+ start:4389 stop:4673 length:285 start_codon:yes stop_codon:yes gene_type:complete
MEEIKFISLDDKKVIERFIKHQLKRDNLENSFSNKEHKHAMCDDFCEDTKDDIRKYHMGMEFILGMILHQLPFYPNEKKYLENLSLDAKILNQI